MHKQIYQLTERYVRLKGVIAPTGPIPIGKSTLWAKVKSGDFPQPIRLFGRVTCWRVEDIQAFLDKANDQLDSDGVERPKGRNASPDAA